MKVQHTDSCLTTNRGLLYTQYMHVEEDNFSHKLIVALKQTNISHVSKRGEKESERDQDSP